jgi:hypothetical protein
MARVVWRDSFVAGVHAAPAIVRAASCWACIELRLTPLGHRVQIGVPTDLDGGARSEPERAPARGLRDGATGLEPATSGVTDHERAPPILHAKTRKSPISRGF